MLSQPIFEAGWLEAPPSPIFRSDLMDVENFTIERRVNGVLIVRVHSADANGQPLPDAVFTFRPNDPQYENWAKKYAAQKLV